MYREKTNGERKAFKEKKQTEKEKQTRCALFKVGRVEGGHSVQLGRDGARPPCKDPLGHRTPSRPRWSWMSWMSKSLRHRPATQPTARAVQYQDGVAAKVGEPQ